MKRIALILITILLTAPWVAEAGKGKGRSNGGSTGCDLESMLEELPVQNLRDKEEADLTYMREEEKLARDVYLSLEEEWGLKVFRQIAKAEGKHMGLAEVLIDKYELEDPVGDNGLGVFADPDLQDLYADLSTAGGASVESALLVGAAIEDLDISDLQKSLERTNNEDLAVLYQNLMQGSRNHMRAFTTQLERYGVTYEPVYLSPSEYQEIIDSRKERSVVGADGELVCGVSVGRTNDGGTGFGPGPGDGDGECDGSGDGECDGSGDGDCDGSGDCEGDGDGNRHGQGDDDDDDESGGGS